MDPSLTKVHTLSVFPRFPPNVLFLFPDSPSVPTVRPFPQSVCSRFLRVLLAVSVSQTYFFMILLVLRSAGQYVFL